MNKEKSEKQHIAMAWVLFFLYCMAMAYLLFGRRRPPYPMPVNESLLGGINLRPLRTIRLFLNVIRDSAGNYTDSLVRQSWLNLTGNVAAFIPLGYFLPRIFRKLRKITRTLLCGACIIAAIELVQFFTRLGSCDVDDLLLNVIGVALGYGVYRRYFRRRR